MTSVTPTRGDEEAPKRILITSHCVLNQNAVVQPLARSTGVMRSAVDWAIDQGWGIFQLPCPEFRFAGPLRSPASFDDYNTDAFHESNRELLGPVIARLQRYRDAGYEIVGGLHVKGSPACDPDTGNWVTDVLEAARAADIPITDIWQIPNTPTGAFAPDDEATHFGDPGFRTTYPRGAATVTSTDRRRASRRRAVYIGGASIPVRGRLDEEPHAAPAEEAVSDD